MTAKVGIPRALFYYLYYPMWKTFFDEIGVPVVVSRKTTKEILDNGVREALADACVPVKLFFGHVMDIKDRVDYLFIPRVVCLNRKTVYCPKFLGLPDMIRHSVEGVPPVIDVRMDSRQGIGAIAKAYGEIARLFGAGKSAAYRAYCKARLTHSRYSALLRRGFSPQEAMALLQKPGRRAEKPESYPLKFAVLGYPYALYDSFLSVGLLDKMHKLGVGVVTAENIHPLLLALQRNCDLPKRLFWTFSDALLKAAHLLFKQKKVDGVLHLTAFGCGPDSLTNKFIEFEAKKSKDMPFMTLTIDEHTGEAGMATRLEAFVDMVRRRKETCSCRK
ncbi:MAG: acyl-CoA dehydratase activase-related protein [Firmicutes bacterium]|nr:acyl-CoA dehydratase activase-related protein [Bacillota bacterium]